MSSFSQRFLLFVVAPVVAVFGTVLSPLGAQTAVPEPPPQDPFPSAPMARGRTAIDRLGRGLPVVAQRYRLDGVGLRDLFQTDPSLAVDPDDDLVYLDPLAPGEEILVVLPFEDERAAIEAADAGTEDADLTIDGGSTGNDSEADSTGDGSEADSTGDGSTEDGQVFELASLPGAEKTIYLDFDGHVTDGTRWNSAYEVPSIVSPPYDLDGSPETWSTEELDAVASTWASVAVDFDPWNVNVTTIEPPVDDLRRRGDDDTRWGVRVVFSPDTFARCGCGGQAYVGGFDDADDEPTFVHNLGVEVLAEAATHQVGHLLGQTHDGSTIGTTTHRNLGPRPDGSDGEPTDGPDDGSHGGTDDRSDNGSDNDSDDGTDDGRADDGAGGDGTDGDPPATPIGIVGVDLGGTVFLGWVPNGEDDLAGYVVEWSTSPDGPFAVIASAPLNGHVDVAPSPGDNHYRVSAEDAAGNRSAPIDLMVTVAPVPGFPDS